MYQIAKLSTEERQELFQNTASKMGINVAVIEKDFWVCLVLDFLFHKSKWKNALAFKGGTSLSKVYRLINRFSEDIDLILDWRILGYLKDEPWEERSKTKQQEFIEDSRKRLYGFLKENFTPDLQRELEKGLGISVDVQIDMFDEGIVNVAYPSVFQNLALLQVIRLEIGALAAWTPTQEAEITPYVAEEYGNLFETKTTSIRTTTAERTFWEKATILHQEAYRPLTSTIPARYSRHYYDLFCMAKTKIKDNALAQPNLLVEVARFKEKFYPRNWARYDLARAGTLKLVPPKHSVQRLQEDYINMKDMIFGDCPSFDEIIDDIKQLENEINQNKLIED